MGRDQAARRFLYTATTRNSLVLAARVVGEPAFVWPWEHLGEDDRGATWRPTTTLAGDVHALAVDPRGEGTVFAGTSRGLFRSRDGGDHWRLAATAPGAPTPRWKWTVTDPDTFSAIAIDPLDPEIIYAGTLTDGISVASTTQAWRPSSSGTSP